MTPCSFLYKLGVFIAFMAAYWIFYLYPNLFATWEPHYLPLLPIDEKMPFVPASFLIYMSDYFIFVFVILLHRTRNEFHHLSRMCFVTLVICGMFFIFYPTTYPRPEYPQVANAIVQFAMDTVRQLDSPRNCFPSMHVALTGVATYSVRNRSKPLFFFVLIWTLLVYVSTLTTKQHYIMDVVGGVGVLIVVAFLDRLVLSKLRWFFPNS